MFKVHPVNDDLCDKITLQGQLRTMRDTNIQTCLQIFVKLMHYFTKFANFFINNCKFDIKLTLGKLLFFRMRRFCPFYGEYRISPKYPILQKYSPLLRCIYGNRGRGLYLFKTPCETSIVREWEQTIFFTSLIT